MAKYKISWKSTIYFQKEIDIQKKDLEDNSSNFLCIQDKIFDEATEMALKHHWDIPNVVQWEDFDVLDVSEKEASDKMVNVFCGKTGEFIKTDNIDNIDILKEIFSGNAVEIFDKESNDPVAGIVADDYKTDSDGFVYLTTK